MNYEPVLTALIRVFFKSQPLIWMSSLILWNYVSVKMCVPTKTCLIYNNDTTWFTGILRQLHQARHDAYTSGDNVLNKQAINTLTKVKKKKTFNRPCIRVERTKSHHQLQDGNLAMKSFERVMLDYLKDITGPLLDPLTFAHWLSNLPLHKQTFLEVCRQHHGHWPYPGWWWISLQRRV